MIKAIFMLLLLPLMQCAFNWTFRWELSRKIKKKQKISLDNRPVRLDTAAGVVLMWVALVSLPGFVEKIGFDIETVSVETVSYICLGLLLYCAVISGWGGWSQRRHWMKMAPKYPDLFPSDTNPE